MEQPNPIPEKFEHAALIEAAQKVIEAFTDLAERIASAAGEVIRKLKAVWKDLSSSPAFQAWLCQVSRIRRRGTKRYRFRRDARTYLKSICWVQIE